MEIYAVARRFMVEHGNPNQWSSNNWPPQELISQDITRGNSYVCIDDGKVVGTFFFSIPDAIPDATYHENISAFFQQAYP